MRTKLPPVERDRQIREAERLTYEHYGLTPTERTLEIEIAGQRCRVRLTTFGTPLQTPSEQPPILLLHGIASATVLAAPLLPFLAGRQVFAVDWPGHGLSDPYVIGIQIGFRAHVAQVMKAILDGLDLTVVDIVGHSLGGQIALYTALDQPLRVRRVALLGAPGASLEGTRPLAVMKVLALPKVGERLLKIPQSDKMFKASNDMALGVGALDGAPDPMIEALKLIGGRSTNAGSIAGYFRSLIRRSKLRAGVTLSPTELGQITHPVLFAWGDQDVFLTPADAATSIGAVGGSHLVTVTSAGHAPWLQATDLVGTAVAEHLSDAPTATIDEQTALTYQRPRGTHMSNAPATLSVVGSDGLALATYRWDPEGDPRGIVHITHGVGEYALRYTPLAEFLTKAGFVVYAHDHRGHGNSVAPGMEPGVLGEGGWAHLVADIGVVGQTAKVAHPGLKLTLVAHSLGSFATQQWLLDHSHDVDAVALSGTASIDLLEPALDLDAPMDLGMFNAAFEPARTAFDWLSRDEEQVDLYIADPRCGFGLDIVGGRDMFVGARALANPDNLSGLNHDLPVYITVGDMDPVNGGLALVNVLVDRLTQAGLKDVTFKPYEGARHEVFNETNRNEVFDDLLAWLTTE